MYLKLVAHDEYSKLLSTVANNNLKNLKQTVIGPKEGHILKVPN